MEIILLSVVVGVGTGVASSLIAWLILFHYLSPKAVFSNCIYKRYSRIRGCGYNYQFTVQNSRRRAAIDLELTAKLTLVQFPPSAPDGISNTFTIPTGGERLPFFPGFKRKQKSTLRISLLLDDDSFRHKLLGFQAYLPEPLVQKLTDSCVSLEELLKLAPGSFVRLSVLILLCCLLVYFGGCFLQSLR